MTLWTPCEISMEKSYWMWRVCRARGARGCWLGQASNLPGVCNSLIWSRPSPAPVHVEGRGRGTWGGGGGEGNRAVVAGGKADSNTFIWGRLLVKAKPRVAPRVGCWCTHQLGMHPKNIPSHTLTHASNDETENITSPAGILVAFTCWDTICPHTTH